jgi:hypothetical protein
MEDIKYNKIRTIQVCGTIFEITHKSKWIVESNIYAFLIIIYYYIKQIFKIDFLKFVGELLIAILSFIILLLFFLFFIALIMSDYQFASQLELCINDKNECKNSIFSICQLRLEQYLLYRDDYQYNNLRNCIIHMDNSNIVLESFISASNIIFVILSLSFILFILTNIMIKKCIRHYDH